LPGSALGAALARVLGQAIVSFLITERQSLRLDLSMDWRVLAFTAAVAIPTCLIFGHAPALRSSQMQPGEAMKAGGRGLTASREKFSFQRLLRRRSFQREMLERVQAIPQVEAAATTTHTPLNGSSWTLGVRVSGGQREQRSSSKFTWVSPDYLRTMDIPLLGGRPFS